MCPLTLELAEDPVAIEGDDTGHAYERTGIERCFANGRMFVPVTQQDAREWKKRRAEP